MIPETKIPIRTVHLLPLVDAELMQLLYALTPEDWQMQTIAKQWKVKDVAAHLLDGNIRILSMLRDGFYGETPADPDGEGLLLFLNTLNADWVKAMKRVSPQILIFLLEATGKEYCNYYASLDPFGKAGFAVNWAGEKESRNWMHIAREYTEKWLHQQQIRNAVQKPGLLMTRDFFHPFIETSMMALPYTYRHIHPQENSSVRISVTGDAGGSWDILYRNHCWQPVTALNADPTAELVVDPDTSWKLFSKSLRPEDVAGSVTLRGDTQLGSTALHMVSVMA